MRTFAPWLALVALTITPASAARQADRGPIGPADLVDTALAAASLEPAVTVQDVYKWLFHATRGGEHAVPDEAAVAAWLDREWDGLAPPRPGEPVLVPLRSDGAVVRLQLRPFRAAGGSKQALLQAFLASAHDFEQDPGLLAAAWQELGRRLEAGPIGVLSLQAWRELDARVRAAGWPAVHHAASYAAANVPAYRVLTGEQARRLLSGLSDAASARPPVPVSHDPPR